MNRFGTIFPYSLLTAQSTVWHQLIKKKKKRECYDSALPDLILPWFIYLIKIFVKDLEGKAALSLLRPLHPGCVTNKHKNAKCLDATYSDESSSAASPICNRNRKINLQRFWIYPFLQSRDRGRVSPPPYQDRLWTYCSTSVGQLEELLQLRCLWRWSSIDLTSPTDQQYFTSFPDELSDRLSPLPKRTFVRLFANLSLCPGGTTEWVFR